MLTTDVAIIGGGFAGLATAHALRRRGVTHVVVLEREAAIGHHASGRGAGLARQLTEDDDTTARAIRSVELLRTRFAATFSPTGGILTFDDTATAAAYAARADRLGVAYERIDRAAITRHWPALGSLAFEAALHVPSDGLIANVKLVAALAEGADIATGVAVTRLEPRERDVLVHTSGPSVAVRIVVDASGAWAGSATGDPPLASVKRHLFVVEATPPASTPYLWHLGTSELYVRPFDGGTLACPADAEPTSAQDQAPSPDADDRIAHKLAAAGWAPTITRRWACQRAFAPDRLMRIGRDPKRPWLVWAAALGGHGATCSAAVGEDAATAVIEALDY